MRKLHEYCWFVYENCLNNKTYDNTLSTDMPERIQAFFIEYLH